MQIIRLLADDLTGALDSAAQFTGSLGPIPVFLDLPAPMPTGNGALDMASRELSTADAVIAMHRLAGFFEVGRAFKKIDSLLRGSWAAELAALLDTGHFRSAVLAPAFPEQGRITRGSLQWVRGPYGDLQPLATQIVPALREAGLTSSTKELTENDGPRASGIVMIADAESADDLANIVTWGTTLPQPTLWIGSAGLARALAGMSPRQDRVVAKPLLGLIGSAHPVMRAQIEQAGRTKRLVSCPVMEDVVRSADDMARAFASGRACVAHFPLPEGIAPAEAADRIAQRITAVLPLLPPFPTLVISGGETLRALCRASEAHSLMAEGEFGPGIPRSRIVGGSLHGQAIISKSGAFGAPDFLSTLL